MRSVDATRLQRPTHIDPGPAPMLQWLKIADLVVDDDYQRDLKTGNWNAIKRIASEFSWSRFSPVFVAPVEGGKYAIIDGQHRTHAAAACGFAEVPCQVVQMTKAEQAASFAAVNGLVTKVTIWNIFKAALAAGEGWAVGAAKACAEADCTLMARNGSPDTKRPGEVYAIGIIRDHVAEGHGAAVTMVLSGLRRSEFGEMSEAYSNEILKPFFAALVDRPWLVGGGYRSSPVLRQLRYLGSARPRGRVRQNPPAPRRGRHLPLRPDGSRDRRSPRQILPATHGPAQARQACAG